MSKPNVHGLPQFLRKDEKGYFLDYRVEADGLSRRKRVRLGLVPLAQAKRVLAEHYQGIVNGKYLADEKPKVTFNEAADSFLAFSEARKKSHRRDQVSVRALRAFFGDRSLEALTPNLVEDYLAFRKKEGE